MWGLKLVNLYQVCFPFILLWNVPGIWFSKVLTTLLICLIGNASLEIQTKIFSSLKCHDIFTYLVWYYHDNHDIFSLTLAENHVCTSQYWEYLGQWTKTFWSDIWWNLRAEEEEMKAEEEIWVHSVGGVFFYLYARYRRSNFTAPSLFIMPTHLLIHWISISKWPFSRPL